MTEGVDSSPVESPEPSPVRTCVGCRVRAAKADLLRIVVAGDEVVADPQGRLPGRGAYLHRHRECWELAVRRKAVLRALRAPVGTSTEALAETFSAQ